MAMFLNRHVRVIRFVAVREEAEHAHQAGPNSVLLQFSFAKLDYCE